MKFQKTNIPIYLLFFLVICLCIYSVILSQQIEAIISSGNYLESLPFKSDRTADIQAMLENGVCNLGPGDFYVSNLKMPANSALSGSGNCTRLILLDSEDSKYAIKLSSFCTVQDLMILGSVESISPNETVGNRHGILFEGKADKDKENRPEMCTIDNCIIRDFSGGGITCRNTGYSYLASLEVSNCSIIRCDAGINIDYFSEFHHFSNVSTNRCYYGCINNGGNNMFSNCSFDGNKLAFLIDNSDGGAPNNTHGSAIGCTFNHSGNNKGTGIKITNTKNGFIFSGCQVFFSQIDLKDTQGIVFDACNFGRSEKISIENGGTILFDGCLYGTPPEVSVRNNEHVELINCSTRDGNNIIG